MLLELLREPWPWYVAGPLIGLIIPTLLILGNKSFGVSSSFKHICAAVLPAKIPFFDYDWRKESWRLLLVGGLVVGGFIASSYLANPAPIQVADTLQSSLEEKGITEKGNLLPSQLFSWSSLFTLRGFILIVVGGLLVGFGTRYAGGCTSGHSIMGLSALQWPSLVATACFFIGGLFVANFIIPVVLSL